VRTRRKKEFNVGEWNRNGVTLERLEAEIANNVHENVSIEIDMAKGYFLHQSERGENWFASQKTLSNRPLTPNAES
jgi:hypothetical protein